MIDRIAIGRFAEERAAQEFERRGATLLLRNFRRRTGELDLVGIEEGVLVIVEVRLRASDQYGGAAASVDRGKQRRIVRTAQGLLQTRRSLASLPMRFDVAVVHPLHGDGAQSHDWSVDWIMHAFTAS